MAHKVMKNDIPKQIGLFLLQYAKLRMLQFYYDCLDRYLDRSDFEMAQMDTDSLYFAVSKYNADQLDDLTSHPLIPMVKKGYWMNLKALYTITVKTTGSLIFQNITSLDSAVLHITSTTRRHQDYSNWRKVVQES